MKRKCIWLLMLVTLVLSTSSISEAATKLGKPMLVNVLATEKSEIKLMWMPAQGAQKYKVYRATSKKGKYKLITTTKKTKYVDKKGTPLKTYYYKVRAMKKDSKTKKWTYGAYSNIMKKKVRKKVKKIAYAGDSLTVGLLNYGKVKESSNLKVYAQVGIGVAAYYNSDLLTSLLDYNPDRLYIMLGVNDLAGKPTEASMNQSLANYKAIIQSCLKKNPDMEIVVTEVCPVGRLATVRMDSVTLYNRKLEDTFMDNDNVYFCELYWDVVDENGYLRKEYSAGDGLHWNSVIYDVMMIRHAELVKEY
ncbi:MAG: GDSL-type esterase/lipase family protein [Eubacteriales bacterium]|nr:GDSL-type esterase/lipase family protein [Eubacteriales bacterium]